MVKKSKFSNDPEIAKIQKEISRTKGNLKKTSDPMLRNLYREELNILIARLAKYAQDKK